MKRTTLYLLGFCLLWLLIPAPANAAISGGTTPVTVADEAKVNDLLARLDEINLIDKTTMRPSERKELRKEVRSIKSQLRVQSGGIYISVGALLIVILLLILLL